MASRSVSAYRAADTRREREEAVTCNLAPDLLPLWQRVRGQFSGTPHQRWEAFARYVEEHPDEVDAACQDAADAWLDKWSGAVPDSAPEPAPEPDDPCAGESYVNDWIQWPAFEPEVPAKPAYVPIVFERRAAPKPQAPAPRVPLPPPTIIPVVYRPAKRRTARNPSWLARAWEAIRAA